MRERRLRQKLDAHAARHLPPDLDLWPAIRDRARSRQRPGGQSGPTLTRLDAAAGAARPSGRSTYQERWPAGGAWARARAVAGALMMIALFVGVITATTIVLRGLSGGVGRGPRAAATPGGVKSPGCPTGDAELLAACMFEMEAGMRRLDEAGLVQHLRTAQTSDGFTLTVWRAYADGNQIVVGYTIEGAPGRVEPPAAPPQPPSFVFTDDAGRRYGLRAGTSSNPTDCPHYCLAAMMAYDAAPLPPGTTGATFRMLTRGEAPGGAVEATTGPWDVGFTLPVIPARVAEPGQTVIANGVPLTLERVGVTPWGMRLVARGIHGPVPFPTIVDEGVPPDNGAAARTIIETGVSAQGNDVGSITFYAYTPRSLHEKSGEWTVIFRADPRSYGPGTPVPADPWIFRFVVP